MKILIIQSRFRAEMIDAEQSEYRRAIGDRAEISFISTLDAALAWQEPETLLAGFDAVIIGGSGEYDLHGGRDGADPARLTAHEILKRVSHLIDHVIEHQIPILGICFGHQLIADTRAGAVTHDHVQKKVGSFAVQLTDEGKKDELFSALPESFVAQYGHKDSVTALPAGATLLASSPQCFFSALRYGPKAYTVQFHPELTAKDVYWKLEHSPGYLPEGVDINSVVKDSPDASRIIPLFIERIV